MLKPKRVNFMHLNTISFLSFIVAPGKVQMDPAKICVVTEWPTPDCCKQFSSSLGSLTSVTVYEWLQRYSGSFTCPPFLKGAICLVSWGRGGLPTPQDTLHHTSDSQNAWSPMSVHQRSRCSQWGDWDSLVSACRVGWEDAPLCLPVSEVIQGEVKLWFRQPEVAGRQGGSGGSPNTIHRLDRP